MTRTGHNGYHKLRSLIETTAMAAAADQKRFVVLDSYICDVNRSSLPLRTRRVFSVFLFRAPLTSGDEQRVRRVVYRE